MSNLFIIGLGGFIGAVLRYTLSGAAQALSRSGNFPYGTLAVNLIGCLLIGLLSYLVETHSLLGPQARMFSMVGLLGALTTFSTYGLETLNLLDANLYWQAGLNILGNTALGLVMVLLGRVLAENFWG